MPLPQIGLPVAAALHGCVLLSPPGDGEASHRILHQTQVGSMGSGTNEQDMGDSESQSVLKMRSLSWSQEPFTALDFKMRRSGTQRSCPECASSCIAAVPADGQAGRIRLPTPLHQRAARRSCMPLKNASLLRGLRSTFGVSRTTVSIWIKKKELSFRLCVPPCSPRSQRIPLLRC